MTRNPGEFELIERLCERLPASRRLILGPGDDCAIIKPSRFPILFTIDSMVEGVHFRRDWGSPELLGERSLTVNLSDIAAMGGVPTCCVVNVGVSEGPGGAFFDRLYAGLGTAARAAGVTVAGGNITRSDQLTITIALLGELRGRALRRDAARVGDEIFVTGTLGDAALGWRILEGKISAKGAARVELIARSLKPTARIRAGSRLARLTPAPAAIDLSDGLLQDLGHVLEQSGVGAEIDPATVPLSRAYRTVVGDDPQYALGGGEDYELLFCLRPGLMTRSLARGLGIAVARVGRILRGRGVKLLGKSRYTREQGWDQLRSR